MMQESPPFIKEHTEKVLSAYSEIEDLRMKQLIHHLIRCLHTYVEEMVLSEREWESTWEFLASMSKFTHATRNEFLLLADILGVSQLVELINHPRPASIEGYTLTGPYYRANAPIRNRSESIASLENIEDHGVKVTGQVIDLMTMKPIQQAILDVWQAASNGLYETQDPSQAPMNLRGKFSTDETGTYEFLAIYPTSYSVPVDGPVGKLLKIANRLHHRPAHIHFVVSAPGYQTLITEVFVAGDENIKHDPVFTAHQRMCGDFIKENDNYYLNYNFHLTPGESTYPKAPIE